MSYYNAPLDDIRFNFEAFDYAGKLASLPAFEDFDLETAMTLLEEYTKFCEGELLPLNESADRQGLVYNPEDKSVTTPDGFKAAYEKFVENGFLGLSHPEESGGMGAPHTLGFIGSEMMIACNKSFRCARPLQRPHRRPAAHAGRARSSTSGSAAASGPAPCASRPVRHKLAYTAEEHGDHYRIAGTKIWITW